MPSQIPVNTTAAPADQANQPKQINQRPMTDLFGFVEVSVTYPNQPDPEIVRVYALPMRRIPEYSASFEDEAQCVALFTGRPASWVDSISRESFEQIIDEGEKLNLPFLLRHVARGKARREQVAPGATEKMMADLTDRLATTLASQLSTLPQDAAGQ